MKKKGFLDRNKVLLTAIAAALALVLQQYVGQDVISLKAVGVSAIIAIAGVIGNNLRGQGVSIAGIIGVASYAFYEVAQQGEIKYDQIILIVIIKILSLVAAPPKGRAYEHDPMIEKAKDK